MRDIGFHFPDNSAETLDMDSKIILRKTIDLIASKGYHLCNIDATVCAERPKINPHVEKMKACLANVIGCDGDQIDDPDCVAISYPDFFSTLSALEANSK